VIDPALAASIIAASPDVTLVVERDGSISGAAGPVFLLLGWYAHELIGRAIEVLVPSSSVPAHLQLRAGYEETPSARPMADGDVRPARHRSGRRVQVEVGLAPMPDRPGAVAVTVRDATARLRHEREREHDRRHAQAVIAVGAERDRIARNLHDNVIQRLFGTGLQLQAALMRPDIEDRVALAVDEIDEVIREIRTTIFALQTPRVLLEGLELSLRSVVGESARLLGHDPVVTVVGDPDRVPHELAFEVLVVTRELLSNVTKHAHARSTQVRLEVTNEAMTLMVDDDGSGYDPPPERSGRGVDNLSARAAERGGRFVMSPVPGGGTSARWCVPLGR
jgi:PAS domain S-box-containing protein